MAWLVIDGYEDEPAAFGVPPYIGFHVRYVCGVFESRSLDYEYITIDQWRLGQRPDVKNLDGIVLLAGAVVPGKYLRGTPISLRETDELVRTLPTEIPFFAGGWAIRGWKQQGWNPLRKNLFMCLKDTDATLSWYLSTGEMKHQKRTDVEWTAWAQAGAISKAVTEHPDLDGPLTFEVEVYQGCVRYKRGCKFCIEPKKGVPIWRTPHDIVTEVTQAIDKGVKHVRLGGMTDVYTYMAEGVVDLEYPIPNPEPLADLLHGLRDDERLKTLHVDNGNPSIIAENLEPATEITKTMIETLSDGSVLSFGLESADPDVHEKNWLNCDSEQLKTAIRHINQYGREKGERGLPKLLPGLNFIAGLNGETKRTYELNKQLLSSIRDEGLWLRRINIRQVEGKGFQEIPSKLFSDFKNWTRDKIDSPLLAELFPLGQLLKDVRWEAHDGRIRLPVHLEEQHRDPSIHGKAGITFGRQIGAYPILIGVPYHIPLETEGDVVVTGHGARSITGIEVGLNMHTVNQKQLVAIPGIGEKSAWNLISTRVKEARKERRFPDIQSWFDAAGVELNSIAKLVLEG
ncbi:MAG: radical SAM protein [Candidatus Thermoplasmatota archaeon]|nr:radical SAM protein [Candidatus Thermoplasmatota archaeon]